MGSGESKRDVSDSYANGDGPSVELPRALHSGPIHSLAVVDDHHLASGGADKDVVLYSWSNHMHRARYRGATKGISKVRYSSSGQVLLAASRDRNIYAWKCSMDGGSGTGTNGPTTNQTINEPEKTIEGHTLGVTSLATNDAYPQLLCSGSRDNSVCLWDLGTARPISAMHIPRNLVTELQWVEGEMAVVQSSEDKTVRVWDLRSCSVVQHLKPKQHVQMCCGVSRNGKYILSGSSGTQNSGGELTVWDRRTEKILRQYKGHSESVQGCIFCSIEKDDSNQRLLASVGNDSVLKIWDVESGECLHSEYESGAGPLTSVVAPLQGLVAYSSFEGGIVIWTVQNLEKKWSLSIRAKY